jgi:hypothetical protein
MGGPKEATWIDWKSPEIQYIDGPTGGISTNLADAMYDDPSRVISFSRITYKYAGMLTDKYGPYRLMIYQGTEHKVAK